jgi:hypothetical protein
VFGSLAGIEGIAPEGIEVPVGAGALMPPPAAGLPLVGAPDGAPLAPDVGAAFAAPPELLAFPPLAGAALMPFELPTLLPGTPPAFAVPLDSVLLELPDDPQDRAAKAQATKARNFTVFMLSPSAIRVPGPELCLRHAAAILLMYLQCFPCQAYRPLVSEARETSGNLNRETGR